MTLSIEQFLIVCPLVFLAGFVDAVAGGGGLISLPAYLIAGFPVHFAIGTNKCSSAMGTTIATIKYALDGFVPWKEALCCVISAFAGSALGAELALLVDDRYFKIIMLIVLPLTALYVLKGNGLVSEKESYSFGKTVLLGIIIAFVIGMYDGFYGPGTGTFLILLLTSVAHMKLSKANGTAKVINLTTNYAALFVYLMNDKVLFQLGLTAGIFSICGNYMGTRLFEKGGAKVVKPIMLIVLAVFFVKVLLEIL